MTAFEVLLNNFYESIEKSEPSPNRQPSNQNNSELFTIIRQFINISFFHGNNLSYNTVISELIKSAETSLRNSSHEEWSQVKFFFMENDLHIIKRDRAYLEVQNLKMKLDSTFS